MAAAGGAGASSHLPVLFVVPNRGGVGEIATALEIRALLGREAASSTITILSKVRTSTQRAFMDAHLRSGDLRADDIIWEIEGGDAKAEGSLSERISALSIKLVIQIAHFDPDMTYWLRKTYPRLPILTLGEYGGLGCSLGFSTPRRLGVLVDRGILARAEDSSLNHEEELMRSLPADMRGRIGPVVKGQFAVAYCANDSSLGLYLHALVLLAFKFQKKKTVTLVLTGPKTENLTSHVLFSSFKKFHNIKIHLVDNDTEVGDYIEVGDDTEVEEADKPILRIVSFPILSQELYGLSLLATTELPALVTGDGSLMKALCAGSLIFYECLRHKSISWFEFMGECIGDIPEIDKFFYQSVNDDELDEETFALKHDPLEIAECYHTLIQSRLDVWKAKTREMLREKDATEPLKKVIAPSSEDEARALCKDSNLCRAVDIIERECTKISYGSFGTTAHATIPEKAKQIREYALKAEKENLLVVYGVIAFASDEELFLAVESKLRSTSPDEELLKKIYTGFFYWLSHVNSVPADWAWSYCLKPEIARRIDWDIKKDAAFSLGREFRRQPLLDLLDNPEFFEGKLLEAAQEMIEGSYSLFYLPSEMCKPIRMIFSHKNISEDDRRSLLRILSETLKDRPGFLEEIHRNEYDPYR